MQFCDFHMHSNVSDGKDSPEEMIQWAIDHGMPRIGLSEHSLAPYFPKHTLTADEQIKYISRVRALKEKFGRQIDIFCGIEQEMFSDSFVSGFDYIIGSVHYIKKGSEYLVFDRYARDIRYAADTYYESDVMGFVEDYYRCMSQVCEVTGCNIIGHFDLVAKFNEKHHFFDTECERYICAWQAAADRLLEYSKPFEINTGAISRGYTSVPYPAPEIVRYLAQRGAEFVLSGDSHCKENICFGFDYWYEQYSELGAKITDFIPEKC